MRFPIKLPIIGVSRSPIGTGSKLIFPVVAIRLHPLFLPEPASRELTFVTGAVPLIGGLRAYLESSFAIPAATEDVHFLLPESELRASTRADELGTRLAGRGFPGPFHTDCGIAKLENHGIPSVLRSSPRAVPPEICGMLIHKIISSSYHFAFVDREQRRRCSRSNALTAAMEEISAL
jgi:hypothetical protein